MSPHAPRRWIRVHPTRVLALVVALAGCLDGSGRGNACQPVAPGGVLPMDANGRVDCPVILRRTTLRDLSLLGAARDIPELAVEDAPRLDVLHLPATLERLDALRVADSVARSIDLGRVRVDTLVVERSAVRRIAGRQRSMRALVVKDARALETLEFPELVELGELTLTDTDSLRILGGLPALRWLGRLYVMDAEALEDLDLPTQAFVDRVEWWLNPSIRAPAGRAALARLRAANPALRTYACGGEGLADCDMRLTHMP